MSTQYADSTLVYVSSVDLNESSGQGSFEKNFISHLVQQDVPVRFFTVNEKIPGVDETNIQTFSLGNKRPWQYISQQFRVYRSLVQYFKSATGPQVIFIRESALVIASVLIGRRFGIPVVIRSGPGHVNLVHYNKTTNPIILNLYKWYNGYMQRAVSKIIVVTQGIKRTLQREYNVAEQHVVVIPNPVNDALFEQEADVASISVPGLNSTDFVFGYVGAVYLHQYVQNLVTAVHHLHASDRLPADLKVLIAGGGSYLPEIKALIEGYGLTSHIICTGRYQQAEAAAYLAHCDCCVATYSKEFDQVKGSSALKIAEYLYFNKFILAADIQDYVYLEKMGFGTLYAIENTEDMAEKILAIYARRGRLEIDSRAFILSERTGEVIFDKYLQEIYATVR